MVEDARAISNRFDDIEHTKLKFEDMLTPEDEMFIFQNQRSVDQIEDELNIKNLREQVLELLVDRKRDDATEIMAQEFMRLHFIYTIRDDINSEMWIYKDGIYIPQAKTYINEFCDKILGKVYKTSLANQVIAKVEARTYIDQADFFEEHHKNFIPVKNGLLHLFERKIFPFDPNKRFFSKLPINYDPKAVCPNIERFFSEIVYSQKDVQTLEEIFGFMLYDNYFIEKAVMFSGSGRNGKSKTMELMKHFLGMENCVEITLQDLEDDGFALGEIFKKKANLSGDISNIALKNTGNFKKLVGRDIVSAQRKFKTRVTFQNYAKLIFSANELPITYDVTPAFWNRWVLIDFPYYFLTEEQKEDPDEIDKIPSEKRDKVRIADPNVIEKLITSEELSGLLNLALDGLTRLMNNKDFTQGKSASRIQMAWEMKSDSCLAFAKQCCDEDYDSYLTRSEFRGAYTKFCNKHRLKIASDKKIKYILETQIGAFDDRTTLDDKTTRIWRGIKLKDNWEDFV